MLLDVQKINKIYHSGKVDFQALHDIDVEVDQGEFVALVGPSGSGKTTLLNIIGCIDSSDGGNVILDGIDLTGKSSKQLALLRREYFGFIFQTYNLIPVLTVYENIELPLKLLGKHTHKEMKDRVFAILEEVELQGLEKRMPLELSGGQQQRVSIARSLVKKPKMVLADEPTANLDSKTGEVIVDIMRKMNEIEKVTFLFSTHDPVIMKHAKRVIKMRDGRIVES
ncbi:ABC transporter ATP-binding protein [Candidatus Calescamantes bacterium]|nr:ABC transporter ATP-binding protein [Candidatus Calescamantes bacterium]MCK5598792.1 ABC transporter ATP-binding protein [bacterium]